MAIRRTAVVGIALSVALIATTSSALPASSKFAPFVSDPRDAGGKLDLRGGKTIVGSAMCRTTISTWGPWKSSILCGGNFAPGKNRLEVLYELSGDNKADLNGYFIFQGR